MPRIIKRYLLWFGFAVFLVLALAFGGREGPFKFSDHAFGKALIWLIFIAFLAYSLRSTAKENFFKSVKQINRTWWGLQIGLDLYISVLLSLLVIWLVEGSIIVTLLWAIPILIFANLAILPYLILNYSAVISGLAG
ncbi:MAG: hypothetical protein AAF401_08865 [Pseudomonadota bacterium]